MANIGFFVVKNCSLTKYRGQVVELSCIYQSVEYNIVGKLDKEYLNVMRLNRKRTLHQSYLKSTTQASKLVSIIIQQEFLFYLYYERKR